MGKVEEASRESAPATPQSHVTRTKKEQRVQSIFHASVLVDMETPQTKNRSET
jgi:hypothetical protein